MNVAISQTGVAVGGDLTRLRIAPSTQERRRFNAGRSRRSSVAAHGPKLPISKVAQERQLLKMRRHCLERTHHENQTRGGGYQETQKILGSRSYTIGACLNP
jgi:hypothetical protein